ncbi:MAG: TIGR00374 family protein [Chloroflexi bacterium]|nr:MAG: TIGR00374 family protein [Chloroflexota bacterium]
MSRLRPLLRLGLRLLGPLLLVYFLFTIDDPRLIWQTLRNANLWLFGLSILLVVPFFLLKGLRWQYILRAWGVPLPLGEATALYVIGIFLGVVTPGQAGDAVKAWYVRKRGYPLSTGLASVVVDRLFDVGVMGLLAASGLYFFWDILPGGRLLNVLVVAGLLLVVLVGLTLAGSRRLRALVFERVLPRLLPRTLKAKLAERLAASGSGGVRGLHLAPRDIALVTALTIAGLVWTFIRVYLLFLAVDTHIPIGPFIALVAILSLVQPATPGGVGGRDAALVLVLSALLQIDRDQAVARALSISVLLLLLNVENVLIGFVLSLRYPLADMRQEALGESALSPGEHI